MTEKIKVFMDRNRSEDQIEYLGHSDIKVIIDTLRDIVFEHENYNNLEGHIDYLRKKCFYIFISHDTWDGVENDIITDNIKVQIDVSMMKDDSMLKEIIITTDEMSEIMLHVNNLLSLGKDIERTEQVIYDLRQTLDRCSKKCESVHSL